MQITAQELLEYYDEVMNEGKKALAPADWSDFEGHAKKGLAFIAQHTKGNLEFVAKTIDKSRVAPSRLRADRRLKNSGAKRVVLSIGRHGSTGDTMELSKNAKVLKYGQYYLIHDEKAKTIDVFAVPGRGQVSESGTLEAAEDATREEVKALGNYVPRNGGEHLLPAMMFVRANYFRHHKISAVSHYGLVKAVQYRDVKSFIEKMQQEGASKFKDVETTDGIIRFDDAVEALERLQALL